MRPPRKILVRCAGRSCSESVWAPMDEGLMLNTLMRASWILVDAAGVGVQPVCWPCAEKMELSAEDLVRVKKAHAIARGKGTSS